ncbi:MAG: DUF169 domain-containing protein [Candidatus Korarchaeum sp.]|nr:DUF169 domain-containing protein [Candidatus Korarchaeum sp.]
MSVLELDLIREKARELREALNLRTLSVGVKLFNYDTDVKAVRAKGHRYCQALMRARYGEHVLLGKEEIGCIPAAAVFGFSPLSEAFSSGEQPVKVGVAKERETASRMYQEVVSFAPGEIKQIYLFPLEEAPLQPDVVVIEDEAEKIMWLLLAYVNVMKGERVEFNTQVMRATCLDCTAIPYKLRKAGLSLGCYGCRTATDIMSNEIIIGFPIEYFLEIADFIKYFSERAIPAVKEKAPYKKLKELIEGEKIHE